jgi:hypothetical protein
MFMSDNVQNGADLQAGNGNQGAAGKNGSLDRHQEGATGDKVDNLFRVKVEKVLAQIKTDEHKCRAVIATFERLNNSALCQNIIFFSLPHIRKFYTYFLWKHKHFSHYTKFASLPILFNFSANISIGPDVGRANLITIRKTKTSKLSPFPIWPDVAIGVKLSIASTGQ